MLKRTRNLALFTVASIVLMAGGVYEGSTHVGRGWLRGVSGRRLEACTTMKPGEWAQAGSVHHNEAEFVVRASSLHKRKAGAGRLEASPQHIKGALCLQLHQRFWKLLNNMNRH